jgi:hypothetical protein
MARIKQSPASSPEPSVPTQAITTGSSTPEWKGPGLPPGSQQPIAPAGANTQQGTPLPPLVAQGVLVKRQEPEYQNPQFVEPAPRNPDEPEPPPLKRYLVERDARIVHAETGLPTVLRAGKVIDSRHYNIDLLRKQHVQLTEQ